MLNPEFDYDTWAINATIYDCIPQYSIFDLFAELDIAGTQKGKKKKVSTPKPVPTVPNEPKGCTNARALIGRALDKAFATGQFPTGFDWDRFLCAICKTETKGTCNNTDFNPKAGGFGAKGRYQIRQVLIEECQRVMGCTTDSKGYRVPPTRYGVTLGSPEQKAMCALLENIKNNSDLLYNPDVGELILMIYFIFWHANPGESIDDYLRRVAGGDSNTPRYGDGTPEYPGKWVENYRNCPSSVPTTLPNGVGM